MLTHTKSLKILFLLLLLQIPFAYADQKPVAQLKSFLATTRTLTANFKQVVFDETGKVKQTSFGTFELSRPGKFRWNYQKPFLQEIVSSSGKVWFYDADLEQVTIKKLDKSMGSTPALLLTGDVEIEKEFTMEKQGSEDDMTWIKLLPKNTESNFKYVLIGLSNGMLGGMELSDNFGQLTRIYFSEVVLNPQIKAEEFVFNIPKGVDVLEDKDSPKAQSKPKKIVQETPKENPKAEQEIESTSNKAVVEVQPNEETDDAIVNSVTPRHKSKHAETHKEVVSQKHKDSHKEDSHKSKDKSKDGNKDKHKSDDKSNDKHKSKDKEKHDDKAKDKHKSKEKPQNDKKDKSKSKTKSKDKHK